MEVHNFDDSVEEFIKSLEEQTIAKVLRTTELLEEYGPQLVMPHSRKIENNLFELRIRGQQEIRIFYTFHKSSAILLHGFVKKSEKTPKKEIKTALQRLKALD
ncbi:MAG: hypothetical protein A2940_00655 [Candidatus Wildermuthbacteria bacterium RIFCSPLOWO2_01_FULL_48_29]|uniref:Addiction module toxin RelE n=2 Tax=Parcubacteria group TaxID=1794811 RepID=A0A1G2RKX6_9BACT|nr:MAG: hypothetical protein A2669_00665 [Candidatus Yanofskybacteria bacterium RIFCSPHIGHO2_01_FULL_48_25b]OHA73138.1 MAG: hypothetical protein A2940_00655 [Candidatus Wildermuthbacteria bacterium RIFCSPLOWO2_01_FULL_48_29]